VGSKRKVGFHIALLFVVCIMMLKRRNIKYKYYKFSNGTVFSVCRVMMIQPSDLDWKEGQEFRAVNLLLDQTDRKITRNQKRKHCEIHHLQKASILPKLKT